MPAQIRSGMNDRQIGEFMDELGKEGYVWQFITLAGFHADSLIITEFARAFAKDKMLAYVKMIQRAVSLTSGRKSTPHPRLNRSQCNV